MYDEFDKYVIGPSESEKLLEDNISVIQMFTDQNSNSSHKKENSGKLVNSVIISNEENKNNEAVNTVNYILNNSLQGK